MRHHLISIAILSVLLAACGDTTKREFKAASSPAAPKAASVVTVPTTPSIAASASATTIIATASGIATWSASAPAASQPPVAASTPNGVITYATPSNRALIITADLTFRTSDVRKTTVEIEQLVAKYDGFVVSNQTRSNIINRYQTEQPDGMLLNLDYFASETDLTVRIPSQNTQAFLHALQPHIQLLEQQNFIAENVAASLQRQLLTAQREQQRAQDLQKIQGAAPRTAAVGDRQQAIDAQYQIRAQEDEAKVQQTQLQDKIQYATISLHFRQPEQFSKDVTPNPNAVAARYQLHFWQGVQQSLASSWRTILSIILFILKIWYIWAAVGVGYWAWRRHQKNAWLKPQNAPTESAKSNEETTEYPEFEVQEWIAEQEDNLGRKKSFKSNKIK